MFTAYVAVTIATIAANLAASVMDFVRARFVVDNGVEAGIPESWLPMLGVVKTAGAAGLLLGLLGVPLIGIAAAVGLVLYFVLAVGALVRARVYRQLIFPTPYLLLAVASLALALAEAGQV